MRPWRLPLLVGAAISVALVVTAAVAGLILYIDVLGDLPRLPADPEELAIRPGTEIFAASGQRIYSFNVSRERTSLDAVAPEAVQALLATEDEFFRQHAGVDIRAIAAAIRTNLVHGDSRRGGSTLTQQLVKRLFFSPEKTLRRKLSEMLLALQLEALYADRFPGRRQGPGGEYPVYKDRLLELYLNTVFFGANAYGITDAARVYFGVSPDSLNLPQAALLMGLINAPTAYNPLQRPERATRRLHHVLRRMHACGYLSAQRLHKYRNLSASDLIDPHRRPRNPTPYWLEAMKAEVAERWGAGILRYGSLKIHASLDMRLQQAAEEAVGQGLSELDRRLGFAPYAQAAPHERDEYVQAALVCLEPRTGQVRAMVGGRDIFTSYYNRALTARRQPGSGFKPIAYLAAMEAGTISPVTLFVDQPKRYLVNGRVWAPANFGGQYMGLTTAGWALVRSANSVAVQVSETLEPGRIADMARRLGIRSTIGPYRSAALGVSEVTVLEMASAYGVLVTSGFHVEPTLVDSVVDAEGRHLFAQARSLHQAVAPELAYQMLQLLRLAVERGTGRRVMEAKLPTPVAGKTGTTNDNTDAWFTGCTPRLAASVWVGFDDRRNHRLVDVQGRQITGGTGAAPIWAAFMRQAIANYPGGQFPKPDGVRLADVDAYTGLPARLARRLTGHRSPVSWTSIPVALLQNQQANRPAEVLEALRSHEASLLPAALREALQKYPGDSLGVVSP